MSKRKWKFQNTAVPGMEVIVHDQKSADILDRVFKGRVGGSWTMEVQVEEDLADLPTEIEEAPKVEIKSARRRAPVQAVPDALSAEPAPAPGGHTPVRRFPRFKVKLRVVISSGPRFHNSTTRDISAGGLSLEDKIPPALFGAYCRIQIFRSTSDERIDLKCRIFADPRHPRRLQFVDPPEEALERLKTWIESLQLEEGSGEAA
ncbi:MAG TPA: PilZ domain-containing protein [Bdellovibrionota bacterium]|nr:PilZ domain-containing protein [Bdellovibrionota bacterium]